MRKLPGAGGGPNDTAPITNGPVPPSFALPPAGPPADPFAGSPAEGYADGKAGIVAPAARPVGQFSAAQVAAAYRDVRKLIVAANLNPHTLSGGSPAAFARLLVSQQRGWFVRHLDTMGAYKTGAPRSTRALVTSFAPRTTQLVSHTIKVRGSMRALVARDAGRAVLRIHLDTLFVYAVEPPGHPANWMRVVNRNYGDVDFANWDDPGGALEPWLRLWNAGGVSGARCDVADGFIHPAFPAGPPSKVNPTGQPVNPYDQSVRPSTKGCRSTTGT
jgi:hypothetical protein